MSCRQIQKKLSAYQDGEIDGKERERIVAHLTECPACRSAYAELEHVWQSLDMVNEIEPSPGFYRHLYCKIHTPAANHQRQCFPWFLQLFPANVFAVVLLLTGLLLGAYMGNAFVKSGSWFIKNQSGYSQALMDVDFFKAFAPTPPGTLGNSYIKMASATEGYPK
jgi:hypothetical protein